MPTMGNAYGEGRYTPNAIAANYRALLEHAEHLLRSGESVVLDGSWSRAEFRTLAHDLAATTASDLVEMQCIAPPSVTAARITERARRKTDPSEATPAVAERMAETFDFWPSAHAIDTSGSLSNAVTAALQRMAATEQPPSGTGNVSGNDD
jgi:hypothetical protein